MAGGGARGSDRAAAAGTGAGAARSPTTTAIQSTIQSIKEVVGGHSDADILDTLRESNMDPNETAQKLLNQDPFHEVKRKRDKKKESAGKKIFADSTAQGEHNSQWMKPHTQRIENDQRRASNQGPMSGPSREFRVVRDNRFQHGAVENRPELGHKGSPNVQMSDRSVAVVQSGRNRSPATTSEGQITHQNAKRNSDSLQGKRDSQDTTQRHGKAYFKNSQNEQHFPGSEQAHVPSNVRVTGGTVGPARRQVGVVNSTRQLTGRLGSQLHSPSGTSHSNVQRGSFTSGGASGRHVGFVSRNIQQNQRSETVFRGRPAGRPFVAQNVNRYHQGPTSNQKAIQPTKEWKPKSTKKSPTTEADNSIADAVSPLAGNTENSNAQDINSLSDKISQANLHDVEHVIIPEHLRVPEYEQTKLKFGSFTSGFDAEQVPISTSPDSEQLEHVQDPVQQVSEEDTSGSGRDDLDEQAGSSQNLSTSTAEISLPPSEDGDRMNGQVENDDGLGIVQSDTPVGAADGGNAQISSTLTAFSTYSHEDPNMHSNNEAQLYGLVEPNVHPQVLASSSQGYPSESPEADNAVQVFRMPESNVHSQVPPSTSEGLNPQIVSNSPVAISSQQQHLSQQQAAQMYPQMHLQHFPNFMPYRHLYSYAPPMPMPNYPTNVPYPSNGNNYVQMPVGGSHLTAGGVKYGVSPYKPVPAGNPPGYGNYTHPAGFTISSPGVIGAAVGVDDVNRMKYKDNNIYASTPQVEASDIWIQTGRELPALHPQYYNMSGQASPGAFVPNPANASFNATAQPSHAQFPGLYHPQQPPSILSPHPMVHQQVPSAIGPNVGVGVAAPGPQVGAYQQQQLGHMNWRPSF